MLDVSVIIPVYNGARFIGEAIESVLAQHHAASEIIVVDDGSSDESAAIARGFGARVTVVSQLNAGPASARNLGIARAMSPLLAFLDADDIMLPRRIDMQARAMATSPDVDVVFSAQWVFRDGEPVPDLTNPDMIQRCLRDGLAPGAAMVRRAAFDRYGMFLDELLVGDFIEWFGRMQRQGGRHVALAEPLILRRIHDGNLSRSNRTDYANLVKMLRGARGKRPQ